MTLRRPTLAFLISEDWFFVSHFWARAQAAQKEGWRVIVLSRPGTHFKSIQESGIEFIPLDISRKSINPFKGLGFILKLASIYRHLKPDLVHHIALKPIILGGFAARLAKIPAIVNAPVGLGFIFASQRLLARALRPLVKLNLRITLNSKHGITIFENPDDLEFMVENRLVQRKHTRLIRGAGVDTSRFAPVPERTGKIRVLFAARLIYEKGILDFIKAAEILKGKAEFYIAGAPDYSNPNPVHEHRLKQWEAAETICWLGPVADMASLLKDIHIFALPSIYREGLPKVLLESMASGKPVVATDVPGCREAVINGETGFLTPPHDPQALAQALATLIENPALRAQMGTSGRMRIINDFSDDVVCQQTIEVYNEIICNGKEYHNE